jgi:hypothetical protein
VLLPADIRLAAAPGKPDTQVREHVEALLDAMPGEDSAAWLLGQLANGLLDRNEGSVKKAAGEIGLTQADFRKWL